MTSPFPDTEENKAIDLLDEIASRYESGDPVVDWRMVARELVRKLITSYSDLECFKKALQEVRDRPNQVCEEFEICKHPVCQSSYTAFAIADKALRPVEERRIGQWNELDWQEDFPHENGKYMCLCMTCKKMFFGHKRRVICRKCSSLEEKKEI